MTAVLGTDLDVGFSFLVFRCERGWVVSLGLTKPKVGPHCKMGCIYFDLLYIYVYVVIFFNDLDLI